MGDLEIERPTKHVELWRMNRPAHNAFGGTLLRELIEASEAAQHDDDVRVVITTGSGPCYAVGADLADLAAVGSASLNAAYHRGLVGGDNGLGSESTLVEDLEERGIGHWTLRWLQLDKPLIAAVNGPAAGGGFCLALLHDLRVMSPTASLSAGFCSLGLAPELGMTWLLPKLIGQSRATELLLLDSRITAEEALRAGLVHRVADDPLATAMEIAETLCAKPPLGLAATLRLLRNSANAALPEHLTREYRFQQTLWESPDFRGQVAELVERFRTTATRR